MKQDKLHLASLAIMLATLFWGMTFAFIKDAVTVLTPFNFLFWRFGIASLILLIIFWKQIKFNLQNILYGMCLGIFLTGTVVFQTIGLQYTSASTASFITGLAVILVALFESLLNKHWPSLYLIVSVALAIIGVGFITLVNGFVLNQGDFWILLCSICFASYILLAGKAAHIYQPLSLTFIQSIVVCFIAAIINLLTSRIIIPELWNVWSAILFCSVFASIFAFILQLQFQKYVSPTKAAIIFSFEPVFATITAAIYLNEHLTLTFFIGAIMIFSAILIAEKRGKQTMITQG